MALGTAPHRIAPGVWATRDGRRLTPAGSAYWEHHHRQGLVTADGHTTPKAQSRAFGKVISPTRSVLPAPPPARHPAGQPTITPGQWAHTTPKQKMATEVTVTLSAQQRDRIVKWRAAHPPPKGYRYGPIPTHFNQPIGFGGASAVDRQMAAQRQAEVAARATYIKAHPQKPKIQFGKQATRAQRYQAALYEQAHPDPMVGIVPRKLNAAGDVIGPVLAHMTHLDDLAARVKAGNLRPSPSTGLSPGSPIPGVSPTTIRAGGGLAHGLSSGLLGPDLTKYIESGHVSSKLGLGVDVAGLLPLPPVMKGWRALRGAARASKAADEAAKAARAGWRAVDVEQIPERTLRIEEWKRGGIPQEHIDTVLAWEDNQAALFPGGPEAYWRERMGQPTGMSATEHAASPAGRVLHQETPEAARLKAKHGGGGHPIEAPSKGVLKRDLPPEIAQQNLRYVGPHVHPETGVVSPAGNLYKPHLGNPEKNGNVFRTLKNGIRIQVLGKISDAQRLKRLVALVPDAAERANLAAWYKQVAPTIQRFFGEDADAVLRGFAVSQANASPTGGIMAVLRVFDKVRAGIPVTPDEISAVSMSIEAAVKNEHVSSGMAAKLHDFTDAIEGKSTRTWMGDDPRGGSPYPNDVHMIRADGFVDPKILARLHNPGPDSMLQRGIPNAVVDSGGSPGTHQYERMRERGEKFTRYLNEQKFDGRSDWTPHEVQALEWSAIQRMHGVVPDDLAGAVGRNARTVAFEMTQGATGLGNDLTLAESRQVAEAMLPHARALAEDMPGLYVKDIKVSQGGWNQGSNANIMIELIGSKDAVQNALPDFAQAFDQEWVQASREVSGKDSRAAVLASSPEFKDPETLDRFFQALNRIEPKLQGYITYDVNGVPGIAIRTTTRAVSPKTVDKFLDKYAAAVHAAEKETGVEVGYTARNIELLTGGQHGDTAPIHTLPGTGGGRATALAHPRSGGIRAELESAIERVRAGRPARGDPARELAPSKTLYQRSPDPASSLPRGATEFLSGGKIRRHYFEGANLETLMHELIHVSVHDLRGSHLDTLAHEFAGGKDLAHWTDAEHEAVVEAGLQWMRTGEIKNPKLKGAFQAIKDWLTSIVVRSKDAGMVVPKDVEDAFNHMFRKPHDVPLEQQAVKAAKRSPHLFDVQNIERRLEFGRRTSMMQEVPGEGMAGHYRQLEALSGELPRHYTDDLTHLTPEDLDYLREAVNASTKLKPGEKLHVVNGLAGGVNRGEILTPAVARDILKMWAPPGTPGRGMTAKERAWHIINEVVNIPRSLMASGDVSGVFRQALMAFAMHPILVTKEMGPMFHYLLSEKKYLADMEWLAKDPKAQVMAAHGTEFTDLGHHFTNREEQFTSSYAEVITGGKHGLVRRSGRAYTGLLNNVRYALNENMYRIAEKQGMDLTSRTPEMTKELQSMSKVSNWATGRGHLGGLETQTMLMNTFLFSPRLLKTRIDLLNPGFYISLGKGSIAQKQALRSVVSMIVGGAGVLGMAKLAGTDVVLDPFSSDFGKIKIGNHRFDVWGGQTALARTVMQELWRTKTVVSTGEHRPQHPFEPTWNFIRGKASPPVGLTIDLAKGKNIIGEKPSWGRTTYEHITPLAWQDAFESYADDNNIAWGAAAAAAAQVGIGIQTFPMKTPDSGSGGGYWGGVDTGGGSDYWGDTGSDTGSDYWGTSP